MEDNKNQTKNYKKEIDKKVEKDEINKLIEFDIYDKFFPKKSTSSSMSE